MRRALLLLFLFQLPAHFSGAQPRSPEAKLSPRLRMLAGGDAREAAEARRFLRVKSGARDQPTVGVFVKFQGDADALRGAFAAYGATIRTVAGKFATADIPVGALLPIAGLPAVLHIDESRRTGPSSDVSVPATGANQVWFGAGGPVAPGGTRAAMPPPWQGNTGRNVIVGMVDTGIDLAHRDFIDSAGHTRILSLWDQTATKGTAPATPKGYPAFGGNECSSAQIDAIRNRTDLVIADSFDEKMSFLPGGSGFGAASTFPKGHSSVAVAAADFDLDGNMDVISGNLDGTVSWVRGNGHGGFTPQSPITVVNNTSASIAALATGDFNHDGFPDVVAVISNAKSAAVLLGNGDGTFQPATLVDTGNLPVAVAVADLDGDGNLDFVVANYNDGTVSTFLGNGDGTFLGFGDFPVSTIAPNQTTGAGQFPSYLAIGDFNGDGIPDLAVADWGRGSASVGADLSILLGKGDGAFGPPTSIDTTHFELSIALGDFNGDGKLDIALQSYSVWVTVLLGNGDGTFGTPVHYNSGGNTGFYSGQAAVLVGDFNGDGKLDIANLVRSNTASTSTKFYDGVAVLPGNGDGTFGTATVYPTGSDGNSTYMVAGNFHASVCTEVDLDGHGTHVAGIAAGNGSAGGPGAQQTPYRYMGMAPEAPLVVVKTTFDTTDIVDGVAYIAGKASALGMPAVVNLSIGGEIGPHDGTSPEESMLSNLAGPGLVVVAGTGNDRDTGQHADGSLANGATASVGLAVPPDLAVQVEADLWYSGLDRFGINLLDPNGDSCLTAPIYPGAGQVDFQNPACGSGSVAALDVNPDNSDHEVQIVLFGAAIPGGVWSIALTGTGCGADVCVVRGGFDIWAAAACNAQSQCLNFTAPYVDAAKSINVPATALNLIAVGSYVTKTSWIGWGTDFSKPTQETTPATLADLSVFSGAGPRRTCSDCALVVQKPDVAAPGEVIMSSYASGTGTSGCGYKSGACLDPDAQHVLRAGTSMATPHVSGTVALLMAHYGSLSPCQVKASLTNARTDANTGAVPNPLWGYGKLAIDLAILKQPIQNVVAPNVVNQTLAAARNAIAASTLTVGAIFYEGSPTVPVGSVISQDPVAGTAWCGGVDLVVSGIAVPNVAGKDIAGATTAIDGVNLVTGKITPTASQTVAAGLVIQSDPAAGTFVAPQSAVNLFVSGVAVPNVTSKTTAAATAALTAASLAAGIVTFVHDPNVAAGKVISQDPAAGTEVLKGSAVNLVVPGIAVPNVVNLTSTAGQAAITGANLAVGPIVLAASAAVPLGNIISQSPVAGTLVDAGSAVTIVVSAATVPDEVGQSLNSAEAAIAAAGLAAGNVTQAVSPVISAGAVMNQNPGGGTLALPGTAVDLVVSSGAAGQLTVPKVVGLTQAKATSALTNAGLIAGTITMAASATVAAGLVISQNPPAGTPENAGASVNLVVSSGPAAQLQSIVVTPANPTILAGTPLQFAATGVYSAGPNQDLTALVTWHATGIASITAGGLATGHSIGTSTISAASGGVTGQTLLTAANPGKCDMDGDAVMSVGDVQNILEQSLGLIAAVSDLNADGVVNSADVQIIVNALRGNGCAAH